MMGIAQNSDSLSTSSLKVVIVVIILAVLAGCSGITGLETPHQTPTTTPTPSSSVPTERATSTHTSTPETTETSTPSRVHKQRFFTANYTAGLEGEGVNVSSAVVDGETETLYIKYIMKDPNSGNVKSNEQENISLGYAAAVDGYIKKGYDKSWIPKRVNVTALTPDGDIYEKGYLKYEWARKLSNGEISALRFLAKYLNSIECGPTYPECK